MKRKNKETITTRPRYANDGIDKIHTMLLGGAEMRKRMLSHITRREERGDRHATDVFHVSSAIVHRMTSPPPPPNG